MQAATLRSSSSGAVEFGGPPLAVVLGLGEQPNAALGLGYGEALEGSDHARVGDRPAAGQRQVLTAAAAGRQFVAEVCGHWGLQVLAEPAALLASELVTNAVVHAHTALELERAGPVAALWWTPSWARSDLWGCCRPGSVRARRWVWTTRRRSPPRGPSAPVGRTHQAPSIARRSRRLWARWRSKPRCVFLIA
jgi:hypothetical protein